MPHTPNFDAKVEALLDSARPGERTCTLLGTPWQMTQVELDWCRKFHVPPSTVAPETRLRQLAGFAGGISIWWKPHAETGKLMLSFIHPENPFQVLADKEWFGNDYLNGHNLDPRQPFFTQFRLLAFSIPVGAMRDDGSNINTVGVDLLDTENCYMLFGSGVAKRMLYGYMSGSDSEDCIDLTNSSRCRECFQVDWSENMHKCVQAFSCGDCMNCSFIFDCNDCEFVFGGTNLQHKKYIWFNEQLSKEEWERRRAEVDLSTWSVFCAYRQKFEELMQTAAWPESQHTACQESQGENLIKCTRCTGGWWNISSTDVFRSWTTMDQQSTAGCVWVGWGSEQYQSVDTVHSQGVKYCVRVWRSTGIEYSMDCYECENCFGCFGLRHKSFCIFNKQYTEEEYWKKLDEIKCAMLERGEYGRFFPGDLSQSGFQFSMGKVYFDYAPEEYVAFEAPHFDPARGAVVMPTVTHPEETVQVSAIPDALSDIDSSLFVGKPIHDDQLGRNFSVTPAEFAFYKLHQLPFPRQHFLTRIKTLARHSNTPVTMQTTCYACKKEITTYVNQLFTDRRVYCREDYLMFLEQH